MDKHQTIIKSQGSKIFEKGLIVYGSILIQETCEVWLVLVLGLQKNLGGGHSSIQKLMF